MCDRHFGGINYPVGGVGRIPEELVEGLKAFGGEVWYGANVKQVLLDPDTKRAVSEGGWLTCEFRWRVVHSGGVGMIRRVMWEWGDVLREEVKG